MQRRSRFSHKVKFPLHIRVGEHGSTFAGNPMGAALGEASIDVLYEEGLIQNSQEMGDRILEHLVDDFTSLEIVKEITGKGLLMGIK